MSKKVKIIYFPNNILTKTCSEVLSFPLNKEELDCIEEMKNTLINIPGFYHKNSLGISANQVGVSKRIILLSKFPRNRILQYKFFNVIINPKILEISKEKILKWEGCLSDEKYMALIERPRKVKVSYQNQKGIKITEELSDLFSRIFLHEYDHLEGKVFQNDAIQRIEIKKLENPDYNDRWLTEQQEKNLLI